MTTIKVFDGAIWQATSLPITSGATYVGPDPPPGTAKTGDMWFDTDDPGYIPLPLPINSGGTQASSAFSARANLAVPGIGNSTTTAGAPTTGTWARGDQWLDLNNVVWTCTVAGTPGTWVPPIGYELAYNQITAGVSVPNTTAAVPQTVVDGTSRNYEGAPVIVEFYAPTVVTPNAAGGQLMINLWDGNTDLGFIAEVRATSPVTWTPVSARRRITPTAGNHYYKVMAFIPVGGPAPGFVDAGVGAVGGPAPAYLRVTRA